MRAAGRPDEVVARFVIRGDVAAVEPFSGGAGHINESHVVTCRGGGGGGGGGRVGGGGGGGGKKVQIAGRSPWFSKAAMDFETGGKMTR
jgi:hypothetical protein